jgi:hypothetical protein
VAKRHVSWRIAQCLGALLVTVGVAHAQELEPRSYSPAPIGTTFVLGGFGRSDGGILFDPSLDIDNVKADVWIATVGAGHVFDMFGRQSRVLAAVPIAWGSIAGDVHAQVQRQDLAGLADPRFKLTVGLLGARALTRDEFTRTRRVATMGASLTVMPPWGQYRATQLVNLGYHPWALKPELGISLPARRWTIDAYAGVWLFTTNRSYFPGTAEKRQDPVLAVQGHASYALSARTWLAVNGTWFAGGETYLEGVLNPDLQRNTRFGITYSVPLARQQSLKFVYSTGTSTRRGSDFNTFNITWQLVMF